MEQPPYDAPEYGQIPPLGMPSREDRTWGMLCHISAVAGFLAPCILNIVAPLVIWLMKREDSPFVNDQGREAVNFNITVSICTAICFVLAWIIIGIPLLFILGITWFILVLIATLRANDGVAYRYPFCLRLIK